MVLNAKMTLFPCPFTHILWDCDDTLVLSEEKAFEACCDVVNETLRDKGVAFQFTPASLMARFVGKVFWKIITELGEEFGFTLEERELAALIVKEQTAVIARLAAEVQACHGVERTLGELHPDFTMAVVSSSAMPRIEACMLKTGLGRFFGGRLYSAATSLPVPTSKPDPAIYNHALADLKVAAENAVAVEDSLSGVRAAVAAGITCIGYLGALPEHQREDRRKALLAAGATVCIESYAEFGYAVGVCAAKALQPKAVVEA